MLVINIIGIVFFSISILSLLFLLVGAISKSIGVSTFGVGRVIFLMAFAVMCFTFEQMILKDSPQVGGVAVLFIFLNAVLLPILYFTLVGAVILGKDHIYRVNRFLILEKRSYDDIIGYTVKKTGGTVQGRFGESRVKAYAVEIHFKGNKYSEFSTSRDTDRKIAYFKEIMESHECSKNGRVKKRSPF